MASDVLLAGVVCKQTSFLQCACGYRCSMARVTSSCHGVDSGMTSCLFLTSSLDKGLRPGCRFGIPHNLAAVRYTGSPSPENIPTPACQSVTFNTLLLQIAL